MTTRVRLSRAVAGLSTSVPQYETFKSEEQQIFEALQATGGNKSKAAKLLGIDRSTLYRRVDGADHISCPLPAPGVVR